MKRLEEFLSRDLLVREPRSIRLTSDGELLLRYSRQMLKLNGDMMDELLGPEIEGQVRVGLPDHLGTRVLPGALAQFSRTHPSVQVDVVLGRSVDLVDKYEHGDLDILLTSANVQVKAVLGRTLGSEALVWCGRDGGDACRRSPLPVAVAEMGCLWREVALKALDRAGIAYRIAYSSDHCSGQEAAMTADLAIAAYPASMVKAPLKPVPADTGLHTLGGIDTSIYTNARAGRASLALSEYIAEVFP